MSARPTHLEAGRRPLDAGQDNVDNVVAKVVFTARDEDLGARQLKRAVGLAHGLGRHLPPRHGGTCTHTRARVIRIKNFFFF